jgi:hypothetical protein
VAVSEPVKRADAIVLLGGRIDVRTADSLLFPAKLQNASTTTYLLMTRARARPSTGSGSDRRRLPLQLLMEFSDAGSLSFCLISKLAEKSSPKHPNADDVSPALNEIEQVRVEQR